MQGLLKLSGLIDRMNHGIGKAMTIMDPNAKSTRVQQFSDVHTYLEPDELLSGTVHRFYGNSWQLARAESFAAAT